jgi:hypothetical protein
MVNIYPLNIHPKMANDKFRSFLSPPLLRGNDPKLDSSCSTPSNLYCAPLPLFLQQHLKFVCW